MVNNKTAKAKKGSLVAMIKETGSGKVSGILSQPPAAERKKVGEVTLDMAASMEKIVRGSFPTTQLVKYHFHVQKLIYDAVEKC